MNGLFIETSLKKGALALFRNGEAASVIELPSGPALSNSLYTSLQELIEGVELSWVAAGLGPGSYIGLRTGAVVAKTLAYALSIPLIGIPSPLAYLPSGINGPFTYVGDAKMGENFFLSGQAQEGQILSWDQPCIAKGETPILGAVVEEGGPINLAPITSFLASKGSMEGELPLIYLR